MFKLEAQCWCWRFGQGGGKMGGTGGGDPGIPDCPMIICRVCSDFLGQMVIVLVFETWHKNNYV